MLRTFFVFLLVLTVVSPNQFKFLNNVKHLVNTENLTVKCLQAIENVGTDASIQMLDASGKIPSGIKYGNFFELGNFDECYNIETHNTNERSFGKYCLGTLDISTSAEEYANNTFNNRTKIQILGLMNLHLNLKRTMTDGGLAQFTYHSSICVPDQCSAEELTGIFHFTEQYCYSKATTRLSLDTNAVVGISVLSTFILSVIVSTLFDIFLYCKNQKTPHDLLTAFSLLSNGKKLLTTTRNPDQLLCLNGIKAITMMWVIIGHLYSSIMLLPVTNMLDVYEWMNKEANMFILSASLSVDTFFVIGGLVGVYTFMKTMDKTPLKKFNIPLFYLHRYLRLTPALAVMVLVIATLIKNMGKGPLWGMTDSSMGALCRKYWWSTLLYIQNYVNPDDACVSQSWYLNVDMQIFVLLPFVLIPLKRWPKYTLLLMYSLAVAGVIVPFALAYIMKMNASTVFGDDNFAKYYYIQTYGRFGPYVIGMILGYFIHNLKKSGRRLKLSWVAVLASWAVVLSGLLACVYSGHNLLTESEYDRWGHSLYIAFLRPAWSIALCGLIYLCVSGYGAPINAFLSASIFQFISKISYSMYLVHISVIIAWGFSKKTSFKFSNIETMMDFWGIFMVSLVFATALCLVFESPVIVIEKCIFGKDTKKPQPKSSESEFGDKPVTA